MQAEYLFKENPEGKMFEPEYTRAMSNLLDSIEKLQGDIFTDDDGELGDEAMGYLRRRDQTACNQPPVAPHDHPTDL